MRLSTAAVLALGGLMILTGCNDQTVQENSMKSSDIHTQKWSYDQRVEINNNATNPKTLYVKSNEDTAVIPEAEHIQKVAAVPSDNGEMQRLLKERDNAVNTLYEMKKRNQNLESQKSDLRQKIERLILEQKQYESLSKEKSLSAQKFREDKNLEIEKLIYERNEAIKVTLGMKKEKEALSLKLAGLEEETTAKQQRQSEERKREVDKLTNDLGHLKDEIKREAEAKQKAIDKLALFMEEQKKQQKVLEEKLALSSSALADTKNLTDEKEREIDRLTDEINHMKDELQRSAQEKQSAINEFKRYMASHKEEQSTFKEKLALSASALLAAKSLATDKEADVSRLAEEKARTEKMLLALQSSSDESKTKNSEQINILEKEITVLEQNIKVAQKQRAELDGQIATLVKERDDAIKVTLKMKKENESLLANKAALNAEIEKLTLAQTALKDKMEVSKTVQLEAQNLAKGKASEIAALIKERDDAIKVTLEMKKANETLASEKSVLNAKIEKLTAEQSKSESTLQNEITTSKTALLEARKLTEAKASEIAKITGQIAEQQALIMELKKKNQSYETKAAELNKEIERLAQVQTEQTSLSKEKMASTAAALLAAQQLNADRDTEVNSLKKELEVLAQKLTQEKKANLTCAKKLVLAEIVDAFKLSKVEFKTGSAILTKESTLLLDKVADIMKTHKGYHYKVQGHTDSSGNEKANVELSKNRAKSVQTYLVSKGADEKLLSADGFGSSKPIADNSTAEGRLQNRRVVFEIVD